MKKLIFILSLVALFCFPVHAQAAQATLTWNAVTTNLNGQPITGVTYNVYRGLQSNGGDGIKLNATPIATTTYVDISINNTTVYYYSVSGVSTTGSEGPRSTTVRFSLGDTTPASPTGLTVH